MNNNYYIATKDFSEAFGHEVTSYWNRRAKRWQSYLTKACIYSTCNGAKRIFKKIASNNPNIDFYMKRI
jgi:DNA-binding transcriptional regulator GbsR (MarR family)